MARSFGAQVGTPHLGGLMHTTPGIHATQSIQDDVYTQWVKDPEGFWAEAGEAIHWYQRWNRVLDGSRPPFYRWFPGAEVNTCYNALDWHVEHGRADQPALIYDSPVTGTIKRFTYRELRDEVARFAGALAGLGVGKGDRARRGEAAPLHHPAATAAAGANDSGAGRRLGRAYNRGTARCMRAGGCDRSAVHPLYVRHDGHAERGGARQRRPSGGAQVEH